MMIICMMMIMMTKVYHALFVYTSNTLHAISHFCVFLGFYDDDNDVYYGGYYGNYGDYSGYQMSNFYNNYYAQLMFMSGYQEGLKAAQEQKTQKRNAGKSLLRKKYRN